MAQFYGHVVSRIIDKLQIDTVLDYGCGRNRSLTRTLRPNRKITYQAYDPGVPEYADLPTPSQMVVCVDVLEHIEPECLDDVLDHLEDLTELVLFATIHVGPAKKILSDGRNAHLIQKPVDWWLPKIMDRFSIQTVQVEGPEGFMVIVNNKDLVVEAPGSNG